jgi:hypothetical protein
MTSVHKEIEVIEARLKEVEKVLSTKAGTELEGDVKDRYTAPGINMLVGRYEYDPPMAQMIRYNSYGEHFNIGPTGQTRRVIRALTHGLGLINLEIHAFGRLEPGPNG